MRTISHILFFGLLFTSCVEESPTSIPSSGDSIAQTETDSSTTALQKDSLCLFVWDTVSHPAYKAHKLIMERYFVPGKRGWWMTAQGDTLDTYLYPQDIGIFFQELDSTEQGFYRIWTNQIVFQMLNHDAGQMMALPITMSRDEGAYFLWHVSHPMCYDLPLDSTLARVERNMESTGKMKNFKEQVLMRLKGH